MDRYAQVPATRATFAGMPGFVGNRLLTFLREAGHDGAWSDCERVVLASGSILREAEHSPSHIYFPVDAVVSEIYVTENGASSQIAIIGHEGMVGLSALMGDGVALSRECVLCTGHAYRWHKDAARQEFASSLAMQKMVLRYAQALLTQMAQTAVCNRHHSLEQQFCRWLLLVVDRAQSTSLKVTQELISTMLGVRREGVTAAACKLQAAGVISCQRGWINIVDRPALERLCCECYSVVKSECDRLMPVQEWGLKLAATS